MEYPEFGTATPWADYILRPGGYAIIAREGTIAVVGVPKGLFLPGGGQDSGESPEDAAVREAAEECGLVIRIIDRICAADQLVHAVSEGRHYRKRCVFFFAEVVGQAEAVELDHELRWPRFEEAAVGLRHESQRWAVGEALRIFRGRDR